MDSRQISQLFTQNEQQFNPIQTFGNRLNYTNQKLILKPTNQAKSQNKKHRYNEEQKNENSQQEVQKQTRIKLLSSYQQSYLQSFSQPNFTQQDQPSNQKSNSKYYMLSYSESKGPGSKKLQKYLKTDPQQQRQQQNEQNYKNMPKFTSHNNNRQQNTSTRQQNNNQHSNIIEELKKQQNRKLQNSKDKIKILQQAIDQQLYLYSVQQRIYQYLINRIENRGKAQKKINTHLIVEKAIDFMDTGQKFMRELIKLQNMDKS